MEYLIHAGFFLLGGYLIPATGTYSGVYGLERAHGATRARAFGVAIISAALWPFLPSIWVSIDQDDE